jgi:hypothetical protein
MPSDRLIRAWRVPCAVALGAAIVLGGCGRKETVKIPGPIRLAYGGGSGSRKVYDVDLILRGRIAFSGMPQLVTLRIRGKLAEQVEETVPDGGDKTADGFGARVVRLTIDLSAPEINGVPMEAGKNPWQAEAFFLRWPTGELLSPPRGRSPGELLGWAAPFLGGIFPLLPPYPVAEGEKWERTHSLPQGAGKLDITFTGLLSGLERRKEGGREAWLTTNGTLILPEPLKDAGLEFFKMEYDGTVRFAVDEGRVIEAAQNGQISLKGKQGNAAVEARARYSLTVKSQAPAKAGPAGKQPGNRPGS